MSRKICSVITIMAMLLCCMAMPAMAAGFTPGTYSARANGNNGPVTVEVAFTADAIESVTVTAHAETPGISDAPIETIPAEIVAHQTLAVDSVSGATHTSSAILDAARDCLVQAGGEPADWMTEIVQVATDLGDRTEHTDVLVLGGGGTGLAAAISAIDNGATDVILVEKMAHYGGTTALSGTVVCATGTALKNEMGYEDSDEAWLEEWKASSESDIGVIGIDPGYPNYDRVAKHMKEITATIDWLEEDIAVVDWIDTTYDYGALVKRIHIPADIIVDGFELHDGGYFLTNNMADWLKNAGADMRASTSATQLLTNEAGDVIGAVVEDAFGTYEIYADRGVVLATGGFAASEEMMREQLPQFADWTDLTTSGRGSTGDGILMAVDAGAVMYDMPYVITLGSTNRGANIGDYIISINLAGRMVVDSGAQRFLNEASMPYQATVAISEREDGVAWALGDSEVNEADLLAAAVDGVECVTADSIEALAEQMGVDPAALEESVSTYNGYCETGVDTELGKASINSEMAIDHGPFYALRIYVCTGGTIAGVKTDLDYHVIRDDGSLINGLYAGGEASNREMYAYAYASGTGVGYALASGRQIGINMMAE